MSKELLYTLSAALLVAAVLLVGVSLLLREVQRHRERAVVGRAIARGLPAEAGERPDAAPMDAAAAAAHAARGAELPTHWLHTRLGRMLVADEDRRLIDQCGWPSTRAQLIFLALRVLLVLALPGLVLLLGQAGYWKGQRMLPMAVAFALGFMLPKWALGMLAARRREQVARELPLFVDLLRLLQGVGLGLDQCMQIMANDFGHVLRALGRELELANHQYARGRTREHSLNRLATVFNNDALAGLVDLIVQIDRHGGAVQEPLRQYGERLREARRAELKERIGKTTVKMTAVMVTTLLPALIIVTAGPGFLAIIRSLGAMGR
ncbi:type II secretion system F family protein [Xenophilus sp. Marseille-Q4582]|uniref:type II secretion system F family protein n=1 Tax=Xenophilus sp. Marseille-Q4582 TaxID=2866600 RepID=UPI001CE464CA|nr:type II secretion system F family protein [Xenophilus sp. Marseille-Q4582]